MEPSLRHRHMIAKEIYSMLTFVLKIYAQPAPANTHTHQEKCTIYPKYKARGSLPIFPSEKKGMAFY